MKRDKIKFNDIDNGYQPPVFVIGMGRSGSTIFFEAFSRHEKLMSFTNFTNRFPNQPVWAIINRFISTLGEKPQGQNLSILNKFLPKYSEAYDTLNFYFGHDFSTQFLPQILQSVKVKQEFNEYIDKLLKYSRKPRFCAKLTGPPRIIFINSLFKEPPIFIDIIRDPRAVISSLLNVDFWIKKGIDKLHWNNSLFPEDLKLWEVKYNKSPVALAAFEWRNVYRQTEKEKNEGGNKYLQIRYEDFIKKPLEEVEKTLDFTGLCLTTGVRNYILSKKYVQNNYKYKKYLAQKEINTVEEICNKEMIESGYLKKK